MKRIFSFQYILDNRWTVLTLAIIIVMLFMIGRNIIHAVQIGHESSLLRREAELYQERITRDSAVIESLKYDSELERYARENYLLQREDEEIFIVED